MAEWSYEQDFNNLNDGDLNGQDSWSGSTAYDVQTSVVQEGAKAISWNGNGDQIIERVLPASVDGGNMGVYMRDAGDTVSGPQFRLGTSGVASAIRIFFTSGNITLGGATSETLLAGYSADTWYLIEIEFLSSTTARARVDGGAWSDAVTYASSASDPDRISLRSATNRLHYIDDIHIPSAAEIATPDGLSLNVMQRFAQQQG